jgi:AmmeMemoRadiSam system protein A
MSPRPPAGPAAESPGEVEIEPPERARLLELARVAVGVAAGARPAHDLQAALLRGDLPERPGGAFVTLTEEGQLRGCMGTLDETAPAWQSVVHAARSAVLADPRFPAVSPAELPRIHLEVSVLGPMVPLPDPAAFRPGVDGIVIGRDGRRGLLLPEVAAMLEPGPTAMLDAVCRKAGLPRDAWRDPRSALWVFRTCRFGGPAT